MDIKAIQSEVGKWGESTFKEAQKDIVGLKLKLRREMDELDIALALSDHHLTDSVEEEAADVAILLMGIAHQMKFDLGEAIDRKMQINRARVWPRDRSIPDIVPKRMVSEDPT